MSDTTTPPPSDNKGKGDAKAPAKEGQQDTRPPRDFDAERELREFNKTNTKVFIGNLPAYYPAYDRLKQREGAKAHVENLCQRYGSFKSEDVIVNAEKRFAFVTFASRDAAQYAIFQLPESGLTCGWAKPTEKQKADQRKGREDADKKAEEQEKKDKDAKEKVAKTADGKDVEEKKEKEPEPEKPRFSAQQKVAAPQQKVTPPPAVVAPKPVQTQPQGNQGGRQNQGGKQNQGGRQNQGGKQNQGKQNQKGQQQNQKAPAPAPQRFKVTVQNETTGVVATVSISLEDWQQYIYPLFENNKVVLH